MNAPLVTCPHDGEVMEYGVRPVVLEYKGLTKPVDLPGWYCPKCGEGIHGGKELKVTDRALNELKIEYEGLLRPLEIRRIRKKLRLTQKDAGVIIGGGPRAFQKYESGELVPSRAVVSALRLLDADPKGLAVLGEAVRG
ncbi:MAG: type II toxin-antitoxin system MqsA family antitoxin [Thermodesulfobacteriota bacterium]